jgi:acyl transferase domain-containing protein/NADPH:quinone reductase-like Zn-dependent oxidoreductase/short-subunit dehydrogenase
MSEVITREPDESPDALKKALISLKRSQARVAALEARRAEPLAIIGMACRLPGGANTPDALWDMLRRGADACGPVPAERWASDDYYDVSADAPGHTHAARAHFLNVPVGAFDAPFFGVSAKEALSLDPQQRLLLEVTWEALEDAGLDPVRLRGSRTGIFTGISSDDYAQAHRHSGRLDLIDGYALTGTCFAPAAGRVSYTFGFEGPSIAVDTACSSSLVAVHLACQSLREGESDLALASGVNLILSPVFHIASSKLGTISPDGLCKTFDSSADGYGRGEGCGVVAIKRLSDAQAHGDRILALIRGSAVNQDGKSNGLTAPNGLAQEKVIRQALDRAGLRPADIGYIEVHGTGTSLGDPIEVEAIGRVMRNQRPDSDPVVLSTVKSNIGHLEAAAGIAGLIKAIQCLRHGEFPAHLRLTNPNPHIPWGQYPFRVVTEPTTWASGSAPRRAGVSGFGFSGTNAHVILEEVPQPALAAEMLQPARGEEVRQPARGEEVRQPARGEEVRQPARGAGTTDETFLLPLSARTEDALSGLMERWSAWLAAPTAPLRDACLTAGAGRSHFTYRAALLGTTASELGRVLSGGSEAASSRRYVAGVAPSGSPRIAMMFTGQGSQYVGMGRSLYRTETVFRQVVDACDAAFRAPLGCSIRDMIYADDASDEALTRTGFAQPAIFTLELALFRLWQSWGVTPDVVCGHSIGEYAAAHVAGILKFEDAIALVAERGRLMQALPEGGAMAAVFANEATVAPMLASVDGVALAAVNTLNEVVISGPQAAVADLTRRLSAAGISVQPLRVSHAFHSPLMRPIVPAFAATAATCSFAVPRLPIVSTVTGRKAEGSDLATPAYWAGQIEAPVRFAAAVQTMAADGIDIFLEVGPTPILTGLARQTADADDRIFLASLVKPGADDRRQMLESVAQLYVRGADINWAALYGSAGARKVAVPGYAFQRKIYYRMPIVDTAGGAIAASAETSHRYLGQRIRSSVLPAGTVVHQALFTPEQPAFLKDHQIYGKIISPAAAHLSMAFAAAGARRALQDVSFTAPLVIEPAKPRIVQVIVNGDAEYQLLSQSSDEPNAPWTAHSAGRMAALAEQPPGVDVEALRARCHGTIAPADFYALIETLGYSTGPDFQCLRDIRKGDNCSVCLVEAAQRIDDGAIHPGLIDSLLQTVLPACDEAADHLLSGGSVLIPLHMEAVQVFGTLNQPLHCHTRVAISDNLVRGQITAYDRSGSAVLDISDFLLKRTDRATLYQELRQDDRLLIHRIAWQPNEADTIGADASQADRGAAADPGWIVFADAAGWGQDLARGLRERGSICLEIGVHHGEAVERVQAWLRDSGRQPVNLVFAPVDDGDDPVADYRRMFADLLPLVRTIAADGEGRQLRLWLLSQHTQDVVVDDDAAAPGSLATASLWGFGRALANELPEIWGGIVDVDAQPSADGVAALLRTIEAPSGEDQRALRRGQQIFVPRLVAAADDAASRQSRPTPPEGEAYFLDKGPRRTLDDLQFRTRPRRSPGSDEIEIAVLASGLNFRDVLNALGQYPGEAGLLGFETVGTVVACGGGVTDLERGDTVIVMAAPGCIASYVTVNRNLAVRKPDSLTVAEAASLPATFLTAHYALNYLGKMKRGDRVLIHAAAGGVGLAAVQLAQAAGAEVFATAGAPEKHAHLKAMGVRHVMSSRNTDFASQIMDATGGAGVDMVLNALTGEFIPASFSVLAPNGRFLEMGKIGIWEADRVRAQNPNWFYRPFDLAAVVQEQPSLITGMFEDVLRQIEAGRLRPLPVSVFPMHQAEEGFRFMAQARHIGKIVLSRDAELRSELIETQGLVRSDASYLVTGGLGALGLRVAAWLIDEGARHIVLTGRRGADAATEAVLDEMRENGVTVAVVAADIAVASDVERVMAAAANPALAGIIHAAGVLDDGMIADMDLARMDRIMAPKVAGAWMLHQATRHLKLDFFVLFSSVAAMIGNLGQSGYAAANAFMDGLAAHRRRRGLAATSINWGPWAETGMAANLGVDRFASQGIQPLSPAAGLRALKRVLTENPVQAMVADIDWAAYGSAHGLTGKAGLFAGLVTQGSPQGRQLKQDDTKAAVARDIVAELRAVLPVERGELIRDYLRELARQTLGYGKDEHIAIDQPLVDQGFDSLMSVDMRNRLNRALGRALPASLLFDYPTLDRVARYLLETVIVFDEAPQVETPAATPEQLLAEIEALIGAN